MGNAFIFDFLGARKTLFAVIREQLLNKQNGL